LFLVFTPLLSGAGVDDWHPFSHLEEIFDVLFPPRARFACLMFSVIPASGGIAGPSFFFSLPAPPPGCFFVFSFVLSSAVLLGPRTQPEVVFFD